MVSLKLSLSRSTSNSSMIADDWEEMQRPSTESQPQDEHKVPSATASASSSTSYLLNNDTEDVTITVKPPLEVNGRTSLDDLRLLAISTNMTELSYNISDIQTRIFEIQELRHQSQSSQDSSVSNSSSVDQALMNLNERLEAVSRGMKAVADALEPLLSQTPRQIEEYDGDDERSLILRKHASLVAEWESVQNETDVLREELKEDKWLTVFRTVSEQADGMMSSLEKAVKRCQEFIWRVKRNAPPETPPPTISGTSRDASAAPLTYETYASLLESFEAKKKHYMPATSKVLSIIDKGVQDRVTKNGECLRRHAESTQRWRNLRERIARTDSDMEVIRKILLMRENGEGETASVASERTSRSSGTKRSENPTTPSSEGRTRTGTLTRSMSPFRKLAKRLGKVGGRGTPTQTPSAVNTHNAKAPSSDPVPTLRHRSSMFPLRGMTNLMTPDRPAHKHSQSFTPDSPTTHTRRGEETAVVGLGHAPSSFSSATSSLPFKGKPKPRWNSSTKVEPEEMVRTIKPTLHKRASNTNLRSVSGNDIPPVPPLPRSVSRSSGSFASSRPWSPITASQASTTRTSMSRPPSRSQSPSFGTSLRNRPKTPSHIPTPVFWRGTSGSSDAGDDRSPPSSSIMQRLSPTPSSSAISGISSYSRARTPLGSQVPYARPPSRSKIPIPKFQVSSASRPSTAMSDYDRPDTSMSFRTSAFRAQTPEYALRIRVSQLPYYDSPTNSTSGATPSSSMSRRASRLPPSSFRESSATPSFPRTVSNGSRPPSRSGAFTPSFGMDGLPEHKYVPANPKDPLDAEVAAVVNSIPHGLFIERIDPPLRTIPKENEEIKAQYAFTNQLARKVVVCRLLTMSRSGVKTKKVMCRVGGGWQELQLYILNRQAGM